MSKRYVLNHFGGLHFVNIKHFTLSHCVFPQAFTKFSIPPVTEGVRVFDETGTEVDADVFEEVAQQPNAGIFTIRFDNGNYVWIAISFGLTKTK